MGLYGVKFKDGTEAMLDGPGRNAAKPLWTIRINKRELFVHLLTKSEATSTVKWTHDKNAVMPSDIKDVEQFKGNRVVYNPVGPYQHDLAVANWYITSPVVEIFSLEDTTPRFIIEFVDGKTALLENIGTQKKVLWRLSIGKKQVYINAMSASEAKTWGQMLTDKNTVPMQDVKDPLLLKGMRILYSDTNDPSKYTESGMTAKVKRVTPAP